MTFKTKGLCEHGTCIIVQPMHVYKKAENGREELQLFQNTKKTTGKKKVFPDGLYRKKKSPELVFPTTYLGLMVLEATRHLQPITGSRTGSAVNSSL